MWLSTFKKISFLILFCCFIFLFSCSKNPTSSNDQGIGYSGGVIGIDDSSSVLFGTRLEIPSGALKTNVKIHLIHITAPPPPPGAKVLGACLKITPLDAEILKPCLLTLPYNPSEAPFDTSLIIMAYDDLNNQWQYIPCYQNIREKTVTGEITCFASFQLMYTSNKPRTNITWRIANYPTNLPGYTEDDVHEAVCRGFKNWEDELYKIGIYFVESDQIEVDIKLNWIDFGFSEYLPFSEKYDDASYIIWNMEGRKFIFLYNSLLYDSSNIQLHWAAPLKENRYLSYGEIDIEDMVTHMVGHCLGFNHVDSNVLISIMSSNIEPEQVLHNISQEDSIMIASWYHLPQYMPYRLGHTWYYEGELIWDGEVTDRLSRIVRIDDTVQYEGDRWFIDNCKNAMIIQNNEWWWWGFVEGIPDLQVKYPMEVGDQWIQRISYGDTTYIRVEEKDVPVETPAGIFNCYKLSIFCPTCDDVWIYHYRWFNPAIGDVKTEEKFKHTGDYKVIYYLSDYNYKD